MKISKEVLKGLITNGRVDHTGRNITGQCPKCKKNEFGISIEENNHPFGCYRKKKCGFSGNIFTLLRYIGRYEEFVDSEFGGYSVPLKLENKLHVERTVSFMLPTVSPPMGWRRVFNNKYLEGRGFTEYDFNRYHIGVTDLDPELSRHYVVILLHYPNLVAYISRLTTTTTINKPKYINSTSTFSLILYGSEEITELTHTVIIVEGLLDKISVDNKLDLHSCEEIKCVCTFKATISPTQLEILKSKQSISVVYLFYDDDVINVTKNSGAILENNFKQVFVTLSSVSGQDPGDLTGPQIVDSIYKSTPVQNFYNQKVMKKI